MGYRDIRSPLRQLLSITDQSPDPVEAEARRILYELAQQMGCTDAETDMLRDNGDEFTLIYDKFAAHRSQGR